MKTKSSLAIVSLLLLVNCASSSVIPLNQREFVIQANAAPICGSAGANRVAVSMAAVETIRRGYERFVILDAGSNSNVNVTMTGPTYSTTTGNYRVIGNQIYGSSNTQYGGQYPIITGGHQASVRVLTVQRGERFYSMALDAKSELGPNWEEISAQGISDCGPLISEEKETSTDTQTTASGRKLSNLEKIQRGKTSNQHHW